MVCVLTGRAIHTGILIAAAITGLQYSDKGFNFMIDRVVSHQDSVLANLSHLTTPHRRALIEIKANEDARLAIREAFGQLLEYAYFDPADRDNGDQLYIVGQGPMTPEAEDFLSHISSRFGLNVT